MDLRGKKVVVAGLGRTGRAASKYLSIKGANVTATDIKPADTINDLRELMDLGVSVECGGHNDKTFLSSDLVIVSPGIGINMPLLKRAGEYGVEIMSELEFSSRFIDIPIIAVTGTNGKTTTTRLMAEVFLKRNKRVFVGGNIGIPLADYLLKDEVADYIILEVSSFQLEGIDRFRPKLAVLLNMAPDHMDRYTDIDDYCETKFRIFSNQGKGDTAIINNDDGMISSRIKKINGGVRIVPFSIKGYLDEGVYLDCGRIRYSHNGLKESYPISDFKLKGMHNLENIMAVIAAARAFDVPRNTILDTAGEFKGLPHRMEAVREVGGILYYNDSKGTNTSALIRALDFLKGPVILIAGGRDKGEDFAVIKQPVLEKVRLLILLGETREKIRGVFDGYPETVFADDLKEAVRIASSMGIAGDTVLFSPACSSFDMFRSYEERGESFKRLVWKL